MKTQELEHLRSIKTFPSLVKYLRDELDWPIDSDDYDDLTFDYQPEELGLDAQTAVKIKEIKQLRPLTTKQPWGIFFVNFEPKRLPVVVLRRILRELVIKKRQSGRRAQQATWDLHDLLFISSYGVSDERSITFAHFTESKETGDLPSLRVLDWDSQDTIPHLEHAHATLKEKLHWPHDLTNLDEWRKTWSSAFTLRYREVITSSKELAMRMAGLATQIRRRANAVLAIESDRGPFRKLHAAFKESLVHDLSEDDFADMYAQTITYGLLTAKFSRPAGLVADNLVDMIPPTNSFLKDLLASFLSLGGRRGKIDFDELGINEVVELLRNTDTEAIKRDFGNLNPDEDPVIRFYEDFLKQYDAKKRMQRGVFFTPVPVVSFIVRSAHEILQKEFGLEDGLADTTTWGEMAERMQKTNPKFKIPAGVLPGEPFVLILDIAAGTGTFMVMVIEVIFQTMTVKWRKQGKMELEIPGLWDEYVGKHLLPRLYGFELMMAPYAIAHMKIGLKLSETGYRFRFDERLHLYLTNTLEPPHDISGQLELMAPALAHEVKAVNEVKRKKRFTVVIGNPPYSKVSANMNEWIKSLLKLNNLDGVTLQSYYMVDGKPLGEKKVWLQDDYVKFVRIAQYILMRAGTGVLGYITNHGFLGNPTFNGFRQSLLSSFNHISIYNLHGDSNVGEIAPDSIEDRNVFDIQQGVSISICRLVPSPKSPRTVDYFDKWGKREEKYEWLVKNTTSQVKSVAVNLVRPLYLFLPVASEGAEEFLKGWLLTDILPKSSSGIVTARDHFVIDHSAEPIIERMRIFRNPQYSDNSIREKYFKGKGSSKYLEGDSRGWKLVDARKKVMKDSRWQQRISSLLYRPFDKRYIYDAPWMVDWARPEFMAQMTSMKNIGLLATRQASKSFSHIFCSREPIEMKCCSHDRNTELFPLYVRDSANQVTLESSEGTGINISKEFIEAISQSTGLEYQSSSAKFTPELVLQYIYAVVHSPSYRFKNKDFLSRSYPRIPVPPGKEVFEAFVQHGADLIALHLLEDDFEGASWNSNKGKNPLKHPITKFVAKETEVAKGYPKYEKGNVCINALSYFEGVPENVWEFHIGGYQVCEKWLKDRRGRTLSKEDIEHYHRIVVALNETIRIMAEIDIVIESRGGWPLK